MIAINASARGISEYEILKYSAIAWITKDHKTEGEQKVPIVMADG